MGIKQRKGTINFFFNKIRLTRAKKIAASFCESQPKALVDDFWVEMLVLNLVGIAKERK
jgi:hypothetical protein